MFIATIVKQTTDNQHGSFATYHIRLSTAEQGPQTEGDVKVLDVLYSKKGETYEEFREQAESYVRQIPEED